MAVDLPAHADREQRILRLWERAVGRSRWHRDEALLGEARASRALGDRNRALLAIRNALFGSSWPLRSDCPACGAQCEFPVDGAALARSLNDRPPADPAARFDWHGRPIAARLPDADDLRHIACHDDIDGAARALLARCLPADVELAQLDDDDLAALAVWLEGLDPAALICFSLTCPDCGKAWPAPFDVADALWAEVQRAAELSLTDIDALARAYGWSEDQVFALSPIRRAAYRQLVAGS